MPMYSACGSAVLLALGFPIRESANHRLFSASPRLIAAVHALHRLLVPRHPPCALPILTVIGEFRGATFAGSGRPGGETPGNRSCEFAGDTRSHRPRAVLRWHDCAVFKVREEARARTGRRSLKTQQHGPAVGGTQARSTLGTGSSSRRAVCAAGLRRRSKSWSFPRKEVIQPHLPVRLPCYDFTPVTSPTFDGSLPQGVRPPASGVACFHGVTGGVYKARERIHRGNADPRLLATPPSCRRVSACNPNRDAL